MRVKGKVGAGGGGEGGKGWPRNCECVGGKGVIDWGKLLTD